jgi:hypothetical protein
MTLAETLAQLEALGNEKMRAHNNKNGAGDNQFGVRLGDIRKVAAEIKVNQNEDSLFVGWCNSPLTSKQIDLSTP